MKTELHRASERGHANHGWLDTRHSFSFADYFNPIRNNFGALRVLNDDIIEGGSGFGLHPHNNMEIISIPLSGKLEHRDSMGHTGVIGVGEVQVMSAGTGIMHSEYNHSPDEPCNFLQIWIFTRTKNLPPRYDQRSFENRSEPDKVMTLVTPDTARENECLWINQDAWISLARLSAGNEVSYTLKKSGNLVYAFIIEGEATIADTAGKKRDAVAITGAEDIILKAELNSEILIIEIPER